MKPILLSLVLASLCACGGGGGSSKPDAEARFVIRVESGPEESPLVERVVVGTRDPASIALGRAMLAGESNFQGWITGRVLSGNGGYNVDPASGRAWSWRLDPADVAFAEVTAEGVQTWPSGVEADVPYWRDRIGSAAFFVAAVESEVAPSRR